MRKFKWSKVRYTGHMIEARKFMHTVVFEGVIIFQMQECASMNKVFIGVFQARLEAPKKKK